jgi:peptide/nickel transport system permease protein
MSQFIIRRVIQSFFLVIAISALTFVLIRMTPGGPAQFNEDPRLPPEYAERARREFGLDQPLPVQYVKWLWQASQLNFGRSFQDKRPVTEKIAERAPNTMLLSGAAILIGLLGVPMGILAATRRGKFYDHFLRVFTVVINSVPHWWLGIVILILTVKSGYRIFPLAGMYTPGDGGLFDRLHHLFLPAVLLGTASWITFSRYMRTEMLEVISQDYIRTAKAKGLPAHSVLLRHTLRNALIVLITLLGGTLAALLSGAVLIENVFSWPGMGRLAIEAANQRDYPMLMALSVLGAVLLIIGNLLADIAYGFVDPRIKYS